MYMCEGIISFMCRTRTQIPVLVQFSELFYERHVIQFTSSHNFYFIIYVILVYKIIDNKKQIQKKIKSNIAVDVYV